MLRELDASLGGMMLGQITRDVIAAIGQRKAKSSSTSTANRRLALIRSILNRAKKEWEWIDRVPAIRLYPEPAKKTRFLSEDEAVALLKELPPHLADIAEFSLAAGLRQENVSQLTWANVDLKRRLAWVDPEKSKTGVPIGIPLNETAMAVLRRRLEVNPTYVFTYNGKPVKWGCSIEAWKKAKARAGIEPGFRWHDLRHTWASWHVMGGTTLHELMQLGAWKSYSSVLRYAHLGTAHLQKAACRVDGHTFGHTRPVLKIVK